MYNSGKIDFSNNSDLLLYSFEQNFGTLLKDLNNDRKVQNNIIRR